MKKSIRHAAAIYKALSKHKAHNVETVNIYDNELDKQNSGRLKLEFNKGIAVKQLEALKKKIYSNFVKLLISTSHRQQHQS